MSGMKVQFWGVRGSIPTPLSPATTKQKVVQAVHAACCHAPLTAKSTVAEAEAWVEAALPFHQYSTFGGNTTCVTVRAGDELIILDMGTGLRELGLMLVPEIFQNKNLRITVLQSHVHWDHIQGFPFFTPIFLPRAAFGHELTLLGGMEWETSLNQVLEGQMDAPTFPVNLKELEKTGPRMNFGTIEDGKVLELAGGRIRVTARKLHHPQVTFGFRIECDGEIVTFCTDHEPYGTDVPDRPLVELAKGADLFITDCQYSHDEYAGVGKSVQKFGWGHSYPEYIARVAALAKPKKVVTTHHDPASSDLRVVELAQAVQDGCGIQTVPAYEGLILSCA